MVLSNISSLLSKQIETLAEVREHVMRTGVTGLSNTTLEGHLAITRELVLFLPADRKLEIGTSSPATKEQGLIKELVEDWIFPASKLWVAYTGRESEAMSEWDTCLQWDQGRPMGLWDSRTLGPPAT